MSEDLLLPKGYGFRRPNPGELIARGTCMNVLQVFERPRKRGPRQYVIGVDVSDGLGADRSSIEVLRVGTIDEPSEQVAEFVTDEVPPMVLAYTVQAIGQLYRDQDGVEAKVAIECNNHGLSTQDTMQLHLGYSHFYVWEYYDTADPSMRFTNRIGWYTTTRTRPILLDKFHTALTTQDPVSGATDLVIHSPFLLEELKDFQTSGALWEAAAARGAHDDCIMAMAIAHYAGWRMQAGEMEPLEDRRRRRHEQQARQRTEAAQPVRVDWRNTPATAHDQDHWVSGEDTEDLDQQLYDPSYTGAE